MKGQKSTIVTLEVAVNIRGFCNKCGITISDHALAYPIVGASMDKNGDYAIVLNNRLAEPQKRVVLASILAICLEARRRVDCLMTECLDDDLAMLTRRLLMPEKSFRAEYSRLEYLGCLRLSALAVQFDVPLNEVLARIHDLDLT